MRFVSDPLTISNSGDMSQASLTSNAIRADQLIALTIQAVVAGGTAPAGSLTVQISCDDGSSPEGLVTPTITNWTNFPNAAATVSGNGSYAININAPSVRWVRLAYTKSSGTGTLTARINAQGM